MIPAVHSKLAPVTNIPAYAVIIRAIHERGASQQEALGELKRCGLWLSKYQRRQAGLPCEACGVVL